MTLGRNKGLIIIGLLYLIGGSFFHSIKANQMLPKRLRRRIPSMKIPKANIDVPMNAPNLVIRNNEEIYMEKRDCMALCNDRKPMYRGAIFPETAEDGKLLCIAEGFERPRVFPQLDFCMRGRACWVETSTKPC